MPDDPIDPTPGPVEYASLAGLIGSISIDAPTPNDSGALFLTPGDVEKVSATVKGWIAARILAL